MKSLTSRPSALQCLRHPFFAGLQLFACFCAVVLPLRLGNAYWIDGNSDGFNDSWFDPTTSTYRTIAQLNSDGWDFDGDGASVEEEATEGSNPYVYDTDYDGIGDGDEIHLVKPNIPGISLTNWDSDGDFISDYDEWCGFSGVVYTDGQLPAFPNATYYDYDGDGYRNPNDSYPLDPTNGVIPDSDGDNLNDNVDPAPSDPTNSSYINQLTWQLGALEDFDNDGTLNFYDPFPNDPLNGSPDRDNDSILNAEDPFPEDYSNHSLINNISWYSDLFGDADGDGIANHLDWYPYDFWDGTGGEDADSDGIQNSLDPLPSDPSNHSPHNGIDWEALALGDDDQDWADNFHDPYPYDRYDGNPDFDGDGFENTIDPFPTDWANTSPINGGSWGSALFGDTDEDTIVNWEDPYPYDFYNGNDDVDGDGIPNATDPFIYDGSNYSSINQFSWYGQVFGDEDSDGILNWKDPHPAIPLDTDGDGFPDSLDPFAQDPTNYSQINDTVWGIHFNEDPDGDGIPNWYDTHPQDRWNGGPPDSDLDGFTDNLDPAVDDATNYSSYNDTQWFSQALADNDSDGILNWYDTLPHYSETGDEDADGILNNVDPYPYDGENYSTINSIAWHENPLGDADHDGLPNWLDEMPYDEDQDGLSADQEASYGTSDTDADCDDDGVTDYEELIAYHTDPLDAYSVSRSMGWGELYSDGYIAVTSDADSDGIPDRIEVYFGLNPWHAADALGDLDGNGMTNLTQYQAGIRLNADLNRYDTDGDGMSDIFEDYYQLNKHSFADAVADPDEDGVTNYEEQQLLLCPNNADSRSRGTGGDLLILMEAMLYPEGGAPATDEDQNGLPDWADTALAATTGTIFTRAASDDLDGDGMPDAWEHLYGRWKYPSVGLYLRVNDATSDADEDGLHNELEYVLDLNPLIGDSNDDGTPDGDEDSDNDGLSNADELAHGTSAHAADTDGDGIPDGLEIEEGTDPKDASSNSKSLGVQLFTRLAK